MPAQILSPFECESIWLLSGCSLWDASCRDMVLKAEFSHPPFERYLYRMIQSHLFVSRTSRFLNKNPINSLRIAYLNKLFPDARFINIVRDPFETVISHYRTAARVEKTFSKDESTRHIFRRHLYIDMLSRRIRTRDQPDTQILNDEHPLLGIASQWVSMQQAISDAVAADPGISLLSIRYEDLVRQPERTLAQVWTFVKLDDDRAVEITARYANKLTPRRSVELTSEEQKYLSRIHEIISSQPELL